MQAPFSRILAASIALGAAILSGPVSANDAHPPCGAPGTGHPANASGAACGLADELEKSFVYPDQGKAYAAALRRHVAEGRYAGLSDEDAALRITDDLQAVAPDGHLRVHKTLPRGGDGAPAASIMPNAKRDYPPLLEQPGWIAPGIAFIRINAFMPDEAETASVAQFMADHADAKAIIFDIRTHRGGGLDQMNVIFPWLFAEPTRLVTMAVRRSVEEEHGTPFAPDEPTMKLLDGSAQEIVREHWALPNADPRLRDAKIYLLTSPRTGSAAEHFALAMKYTGRAKLVGTPTAGANHFGGGVELPGGFEAFLPVGRTFDSVTGKDWEGDGVQPDITVEPAKALEWVLADLGLAPAESRKLAASHAPTASMEPKRP